MRECDSNQVLKKVSYLVKQKLPLHMLDTTTSLCVGVCVCVCVCVCVKPSLKNGIISRGAKVSSAHS